jgi:tetratricopeptide (TPR) repeat protein
VALQNLDKVLRVWGEENVTSSVHYGRARVLYLKLDDASVVEATTKSVDLDRNLDGAYRFRACAYARLGNFAKAKSDNEKAIEIAKVPAINLKWEDTPMAAAYYAEFESDRKIINAMAAGTATAEERAKLCGDLWRYRETPRTRSSLLPAKG